MVKTTLAFVALASLVSCGPYNSSLFGTSSWDSEFAKIEEKPVKYRDFTLKSLSTGEPTQLTKLMEGKKLVMVVYFAPWCGNWHHEMPFVTKLFERYKNHGFAVVGVNEYGPANSTKTLLASGTIPYPVVIESEERDQFTKTSHYDYRRFTGDLRKWGSPWHIFIEPAEIAAKGEFLLEKTWVANGELIESDAEAFIRKHLGIESSL